MCADDAQPADALEELQLLGIAHDQKIGVPRQRVRQGLAGGGEPEQDDLVDLSRHVHDAAEQESSAVERDYPERAAPDVRLPHPFVDRLMPENRLDRAAGRRLDGEYVRLLVDLQPGN